MAPERIEVKADFDVGHAFEPPVGAGRDVGVVARKPTFLQKERWKAVQKARRKGVSLRAIEREWGIHRPIVRSYFEAGGPPSRRQKMVPNPSTSDTMAA